MTDTHSGKPLDHLPEEITRRLEMLEVPSGGLTPKEFGELWGRRWGWEGTATWETADLWKISNLCASHLESSLKQAISRVRPLRSIEQVARRLDLGLPPDSGGFSSGAFVRKPRPAPNDSDLARRIGPIQQYDEDT